VWDRAKRTWRDAKTRKAVGFEGRLAKDGTVIPAPPLAHGTTAASSGAETVVTHQAKQDATDPERAYDSDTGQILSWDRKNKTWVDLKTGEAMGFHGRRVVSVAAKPQKSVANPQSGPGTPTRESKVATVPSGSPSTGVDNGAVDRTSSASGSGVPQSPTPALKLIPEPPLVALGSGATIHAQQDLNNPDRAYDPTTGQTLIFDRDRKSWIDTRTGQAVGFQGALAKDGAVIPAPPVIFGRSGDKHQAEQDKTDPERAYDPITGQSLIWDRNQSTWIDTSTRTAVGFQGAYVSDPTSPGPPGVGTNEPASPVPGFGFGFGSGSWGPRRW